MNFNLEKFSCVPYNWIADMQKNYPKNGQPVLTTSYFSFFIARMAAKRNNIFHWIFIT